MDRLINELLETYSGQIIDKSRDELILADEICQRDQADLGKLEEQYAALELSETEKLLINKYISCIETIAHRNADLSYIAGVSDTVRLLRSLDLLRGLE